MALITQHAALRDTVTGSTPMPTVYAYYRFTAKLRANGDMLARDIDRVTARARRAPGHRPDAADGGLRHAQAARAPDGRERGLRQPRT